MREKEFKKQRCPQYTEKKEEKLYLQRFLHEEERGISPQERQGYQPLFDGQDILGIPPLYKS